MAAAAAVIPIISLLFVGVTAADWPATSTDSVQQQARRTSIVMLFIAREE